MRARYLLACVVALLAASAASAQDTPTPTPAPTATATVPRDEWVSTHRFQRACATTGEIAAGAIASVCVSWPVPGRPDGIGAAAGDAEAWCSVSDTPTASAATLQVHHLSSDSETQACAAVFNRDATAARTGTLCCWGYRWGRTDPTPTPG